jgi:type IV secretion system protein VirD4
MHLPSDEEIVMVSGIHPIRAKKAAYYTDPRLAARIMAPPDPAAWTDREVCPDDWRHLPPIAPDDAMMRAFARQREQEKGTGQREGKPGKADGEKPDTTGESEAAADIRQEPDQERHIDIAPKPRASPANEFDPDEPEPDADAIRNREIRRDQAMNARRASMDRDDGIEL